MVPVTTLWDVLLAVNPGTIKPLPVVVLRPIFALEKLQERFALSG